VSKLELNLNYIQTRLDLKFIVEEFVVFTVRGHTDVFASGPGGMISNLRTTIAGVDKGAEIWKGEERWEVWLTCDDKL
jgi:hypothetical protein